MVHFCGYIMEYLSKTYLLYIGLSILCISACLLWAKILPKHLFYSRKVLHIVCIGILAVSILSVQKDNIYQFVCLLFFIEILLIVVFELLISLFLIFYILLLSHHILKSFIWILLLILLLIISSKFILECIFSLLYLIF